MKHCLSAIIFFFTAFTTSFATEIDVPDQMEFAGIKLRIKENARQKIAENARKLRMGGKYYQAKLDRINLYFPIIERVLAEEGLPGDFKYLVIQESDLISDAVSTSNAVGFWQFKKETAQEMGLTVNGDVDERKHIVASTRAAARYLKKNNFFMQNWLHALLSYNMGVGGCRAFVGDKDKGADRMDIDNDTHWYIIKFLAHQVALREEIGQSSPPLALLEYHNVGGKTLQNIAHELELDEEQLAFYNKWLDTRRVPGDKDYPVIIPAPLDRLEVLAARIKVAVPSVSRPTSTLASTRSTSPIVDMDVSEQARFPELRKDAARGARFYRVNGKPGIMAQAGDISAKLASQADLSLSKFLMYNDLEANTLLVPGQVYYLKRKRSKAKIHYHIATEGETLWQISQKHGITMAALLRKNRMKQPEKLEHGRVVWLRYIRPASTPVEVKNIPRLDAPIAQKETMHRPARSTPKPVAKNTTTATAKEPIAGTAANKSTIGTESAPGGHRPIERSPVSSTKTTITPKTGSATTISTPQTTTVVSEKEVVRSTESGHSTATHVEVEPLIFLKTHEVAASQTLYSIAKLYSVSVADLRRWNNLSDTDGLRIGQMLIVGEEPADPVNTNTRPAVTPVSSTIIEPFTEYTVQAGDTMYKISKLYGVTVQQLMDWNEKTTPNVAVGEKLKIKK